MTNEFKDKTIFDFNLTDKEFKYLKGNMGKDGYLMELTPWLQACNIAELLRMRGDSRSKEAEKYADSLPKSV